MTIQTKSSLNVHAEIEALRRKGEEMRDRRITVTHDCTTIIVCRRTGLSASGVNLAAAEAAFMEISA